MVVMMILAGRHQPKNKPINIRSPVHLARILREYDPTPPRGRP